MQYMFLFYKVDLLLLIIFLVSDITQNNFSVFRVI